MADKTSKEILHQADESQGNEEVSVTWHDAGDGTFAKVFATILKAGSAVIGALAASENHIGKVGGEGVTSDASVAMPVAGAYSANDYVGANATPITFSNCARINGGSGWILGAVLIDKALQSKETELWLFDDTITPPNDNAAWTISDADMQKFLGVIEFQTYFASALNSGANPENTKAVRFTCQSGSKNLYGAIVTRGTPTYASGDLFVRLMIIQD